MSGYGTCIWTCGECGDSYEASGVVGDMKVDRWMRDHKEQHRIEKMSEDERCDYYKNKSRAWFPPSLVKRTIPGADSAPTEGAP